MSLTLGEKLRQAREERGFTLSEVAEQTRISGLYLESIENDDYSRLPGGIFNKGFVKSYAKFVGVNEQEALLDYSNLIAQSEGESGDELRVYRPEVLTDERHGRSMVPTAIVAIIILGVMTGGILLWLRYRSQPDSPASNNVNATISNANQQSASNIDSNTLGSDVPTMGSVKVEFKALNAPVSLSATADGQKSENIITPGTPAVFEPRDSLRLSYSRSLAGNVELTINGKQIATPAVPLSPKRATIEFEITKDNLNQIWQAGKIAADVPAANVDTNTVAPPPAETPASTPSTPRPTPSPRATAATNTNRPATNTAPRSSPTVRTTPSSNTQ